MRFSPASQVTIAFSGRLRCSSPIRRCGRRRVVGEIGGVVEIAVPLAKTGDPRARPPRAAAGPARSDASSNCRSMTAASPSSTCSAGKFHEALRGSISIWMNVCRVGSSSPGFPRRCRLGRVWCRREHQVGLGDAGVRRPRCRRCRTRPAPADGFRRRTPLPAAVVATGSPAASASAAMRHRPARCVRRSRL